MAKKEMIPKKAVEEYLSKKLKQKAHITRIELLGAGWHGRGYRIFYRTGRSKTPKTLILRMQRPVNFAHEFSADRARAFLVQHKLSSRILNHAKSHDVVGYSKKQPELVSIGDCNEFLQLVEEVEGISYFDDLRRIMKTGELTKLDIRRALALSNYLVALHSKKFKVEQVERAMSIHRRHTRDCVGNGEMLMGVIDSYPDELTFTNKKEIIDILKKAVEFRENIKDKHMRLCRVHGDFHPGNVVFADEETTRFKVLDASREFWGEPADDIASMGINYIWYAVRQKGNFSGAFKELFDIFWNSYINKTKDFSTARLVGLFFAFRGMVIVHPKFYAEQSDDVRRKMIRFVKNVLTAERFDYRKINNYLRG